MNLSVVGLSQELLLVCDELRERVRDRSSLFDCQIGSEVLVKQRAHMV